MGEGLPGGDTLLSRLTVERLRARGHDLDLVPGACPPWGRIHFRLPWEPRNWDNASEALKEAAKRFGYAADLTRFKNKLRNDSIVHKIVFSQHFSAGPV
jgi:hypothetical protein